jgi:hypothetical protein
MQAAAMQARAMQAASERGWPRHRLMAADLACPAAREWCAFSSAHPA